VVAGRAAPLWVSVTVSTVSTFVKPPAKTQWAMGAYTNSSQREMNVTYDPNFSRSADAPVISAGVMMANVI